MTYGLTVWDAQGNVQMTTDDFTYQQLHNQVYDLKLAASYTVSVPGFDPSKCVATILPTDSATEAQLDEGSNALPYMTVSVGSIIIARANPSAPASSAVSLLRFRLLVMRYSN